MKEVVKEQKEDEEEEPAEAVEEEEGEKKQKFNPNDYEWTISNGNSKNVLQVFKKLQPNVQETHCEVGSSEEINRFLEAKFKDFE